MEIRKIKNHRSLLPHDVTTRIVAVGTTDGSAT